MRIKHDNDKLEDIADMHQHAIDHVSGLGFYKNTCMDVAREYHEHMMRLRPASEYDESMGDVLWFSGNKPAVMGDGMDRDMTDDLDGHIEAITHFQLIQVPE